MLVAQISDLHIKPRGQLAYGWADTAAALGRCVVEIGRLPQKPDIILISGDLTDGGTEEEYAHLGDLLAPLAQNLLAIPGNHDNREAMRAAFAERGFLPRDRFLHFSYDDVALPMRILGLDTVVAGRSGGLLCAERLAWLEAQLAEKADRPTLIAMHHPPFATGIAHMDAIGLEGCEEFSEIVQRYPSVELITCGHVHRLVRATVGGRPTLICPGTSHVVHLDLDESAPATFRMEPPGFLLHWWNGGSLVTHMVPIGDFDGPFPFFDEKDQLLV